MALLTHSGAGASDFAVAGTFRQDISDVLFASLYFENNVLGLTTVGEEFVSPEGIVRWVEDSLNQYKVTDTAGFSSTTTATISVSNADAAVLDIGYVLSLDTNPGSGEYIQVTGINGGTITVTRGFGGTTAATTAANTVWRIVAAPTYQNSDLGKDMSRARVAKSNYLMRHELNVNIGAEAIIAAQRGYTAGVRDELAYQFNQRLLEMKRKMQNAYWFGLPKSSPDGGDYSVAYGLFKWLDGTANTSASPVTAAATLTDSTINTLVKNIHGQGAVPNVVIGGPNAVEKIGQLYMDRIRMSQDEKGRGFYARTFTPSVGGDLQLVEDFYLGNSNGSIAVAVVDLNRVRIRPFAESFMYTITAPSFRDGDAVRALSKWSLEVRNSGTDVGYASQLQTNLSV